MLTIVIILTIVFILTILILIMIEKAHKRSLIFFDFDF